MSKGGVEMKRYGILLSAIVAFVLAIAASAQLGHSATDGDRLGLFVALAFTVFFSLVSYLLGKKYLLSPYRELEDANLELHLKQEELLDVKDDLFIKFLGIYDVNYAANSPRLFPSRLADVADITARVMEADACFIFLYDKKKDDLVLSASNGVQEGAIGKVRIPLGQRVEGWVGRRLDPLMLKDYRSDARAQDVPGLALAEYQSVYCLPLFVYSNGALVGVMETFYRKSKSFSDEEINFFTTLSGLLSTTIQNELMQDELRKMNVELEQWVAEKTEELRASEERYRTLVENACESIFLLAENGDIVFANDQTARLTACAKYDLLHKNLLEFFVDAQDVQAVIDDSKRDQHMVRHGDFRRADGTVIPVSVSAVGLSLMGRRFIQAVVRDISGQVTLEKRLAEKERELIALKSRLAGSN
jgi:PAS domain S-box-containing protein